MTRELGSRRLLILGCSSRKRHDPAPLPAIERYDGVNYRVLARALRAAGEGYPNGLPDYRLLLDALGLDVLIVSAEFGLLTPVSLIPDYDRRMTAARALELQTSVSAGLDARFAVVPYREVFVNLGKVYMAATEGSEQLGTHPHVTYAVGGIGQKMAQMKHWLNQLAY